MYYLLWSKWGKIAVGFLIVGIVGVGVWFNRGETKEESPPPLLIQSKKEIQTKEEPVQEIVVDIKGAIQHPGIYHMRQGDRLYQLIEKAGGLLKEADDLQINRAQMIEDGMMIYIPAEGEDAVGPLSQPMQSAVGGDQRSWVYINSATVSDLEKLDGIGTAKAQAIVQYRDENGAFQSIEDLTKVPGIGKKTLERFRDQIRL